MRTLEVLIEEKNSGSVHPVEVPADVLIVALIPALVEELKLPQTNLSGKKLIYFLRYPASKGHILPHETTLRASSIEPGAKLLLDSFVLSGSVAALLYSRLQKPYHGASLFSLAMGAEQDAFPMAQYIETHEYLPPDKKQSTDEKNKTDKKKNRRTRRAFLATAGGLLLAGGVAASYAAYATRAMDQLMFMGQPTQPGSIQYLLQSMPLIPTTASLQITFTGHQQAVRSVSWSPDEMVLASGADDARVLIWNVNGTIQHNIAHPTSVSSLAWSSDGQRLVTAAGTQVAFFNTRTGMALASSTHHHIQQVRSVAWASRGQMAVVSGSADKHAIVWDTVNYRPLTIFALHTLGIEAVTWSADGQNVASASQGGAVRVWNAALGRELHNYYLDAAVSMRAAAFAPAGMELAVGGDDGSVRLWDALTCRRTRGTGDAAQCVDVPQRLQISQKAIRSLAWSPSGHLLAVGTEDGMLTAWDVARSQAPVLTATQHDPVESVTWSPDGTRLATTAGNNVNIWKLT